jgi:hypothetical protein
MGKANPPGIWRKSSSGENLFDFLLTAQSSQRNVPSHIPERPNTGFEKELCMPRINWTNEQFIRIMDAQRMS